MIDGVPLPADFDQSTLDKIVISDASGIAGFWVGRWDNFLKHILIVDGLEPDSTVSAWYAWGDNPHRDFKAGGMRVSGRLDGDTLVLSGSRLSASYKVSSTGRLQGVFGDDNGFAVLRRLEALDDPDVDTSAIWDVGVSQFLETDLVDGGKPVRLEAVIYAPDGEGPFPLAVVNHGSTGSGTDESIVKWSWRDSWLAEYLNQRGWIVAFPQRRGRGRSDGIYDEGFNVDRSRGYTCEEAISLAGYDRALEDLEAAVVALRRRSDVSDAPLLLAGQSRGGSLSIGYAGKHPENVSGVVNFVGGWLGDGCDTAVAVNQSIFDRGASYPGQMLWLYGRDDVYYSIKHMKSNHQAFLDAGGQAKFSEITVAGENNGHHVLVVPPLWEGPVGDYLDELPKSRP